MGKLSRLTRGLPGIRMTNIFNYLENIADSVELIENEKHFSNSYEYVVTIKKNNYSKTFQININSHHIQHVIIDGRIVKSNMEISMALLSIADEIFLIENPDVKDMLTSLRCPNEICPICDSKLRKKIVNSESNHYVLMCANKCYSTDVYSLIEKENNMIIDIYIFGDTNIDTYSRATENDNLKIQQVERIKKIHEAYEMIKYWKENDRYLCKMLD